MTPDPIVRLYPNVHLGRNVSLDDFVVLGRPARGRQPGSSPVVIGDNATLRSHTVVYGGVSIGSDFESGHAVLVREDTKIGDGCSIGSGSVVEFSVTIEDGVRLHSQCFVCEYSVLRAGCWLGPRVVLTNAKYPASSRAKQNLRPVVVGERAVVGANATILPGVTLGPGCLVGAGAVVSRDVPSDTVVVGVPARPVGSVSTLEDVHGLVYGHSR